MPKDDLARWRHSHRFEQDTSGSERRTRFVIVITATMMVVEIAAGVAFQSMALLADGWHMGTHAAAFLITALAYWLGRRHADDPRFSFGTAKIGVLGGFASAVILGVVALFMAAESIQRTISPLNIDYTEALWVAVAGLLVNLVCARLLHSGDGNHGHSHHTMGAPIRTRTTAISTAARHFCMFSRTRSLPWSRSSPCSGENISAWPGSIP